MAKAFHFFISFFVLVPGSTVMSFLKHEKPYICSVLIRLVLAHLDLKLLILKPLT